MNKCKQSTSGINALNQNGKHNFDVDLLRDEAVQLEETDLALAC